MNAKHTPGPWAVERPYNEPGIYVTGANPRTSNPLICRLMDQAQAPEGEANARLIAAAPDLLALVERMAHVPMGDALRYYVEIGNDARLILARATGGAKIGRAHV